MINSTDLKNGVTFLHYGTPYQVTKYSLIKMGRGGAVVKILARNLVSGSNEEISYSSNVSVDEANTTKRTLQYLYKDATTAFFMDGRTFEQVEIPLKVLGDQALFLKEGTENSVLFWDSKKPDAEPVALSIDIPPKVVMTVGDTDASLKGNSASNVFKSATLENGLVVKVPLFINRGDKIRVDTRTWEYIERAK
ncbi:MAG TPA: elongation factor P [Patescibacteria group bacterium]|nr:elongation factor P [Patescibacteria group bacterium]